MDHSDTTLRLGFVTDIHHTRLNDGSLEDGSDGGSAETTPAKPKECPQCHYVRAPKVPTCPSCGHVTESVSRVETREGELVDLTAARKANANEDWSEKVSFVRQLKAYQIASGKAPGWVSHKYKAKYGVFPNHPKVKYAPPAASVTPEVKSWIQAQNIRYAKARERASA